VGLRSQDSIRSPKSDKQRRGGDIAIDAPPQRDPDHLAFSEDLGGVVDPDDADLIDARGWTSWSKGERLTVVGLLVLMVAVLVAAALAIAL
jgi:hypothetical protein